MMAGIGDSCEGSIVQMSLVSRHTCSSVLCFNAILALSVYQKHYKSKTLFEKRRSETQSE